MTHRERLPPPASLQSSWLDAMTPNDRTIAEVAGQLRIGRRTVEAWLAADRLRRTDQSAMPLRGGVA
jgi:hypothetical protein